MIGETLADLAVEGRTDRPVGFLAAGASPPLRLAATRLTPGEAAPPRPGGGGVVVFAGLRPPLTHSVGAPPARRR